jgi:tight adherence protein B
MKMLADGRHPHEALAALRAASRAADLAKIFPLLGSLDRLLTQAGASASIGRALLAMAACTAVALALLRVLTALPPPLASTLAGALGVGLPVLHLMLCRARRRRRFEEQLPEAVELLARSLRAGDTLSGALAAIAREMPDPLGSEFGVVVGEIAYGRAPDAALARLEERLELPDLRYLTLAVRIRSGADGNLAAALDGLAKVMRDQFRMYRGISGGTAEGH